MSEELGVDGAFRNRTAVDGEIFLASARGIVVNHAGDDLLTYTTLSDDEYRQVGWRHL